MTSTLPSSFLKLSTKLHHLVSRRPIPRMFSSAASSSEVNVQVDNRVGLITLNRPKALNALSLDMVRFLYPLLKQWKEDGTVSLIVMEGAGEKAFCAGGDVVKLTEVRESQYQKDFYREEYLLNNLIGTMPVIINERTCHPVERIPLIQLVHLFRSHTSP